MSDIAALKTAARKAGFARRRDAHGRTDPKPAQDALADMLAAWRGRPLAGYMPIRSEIDPLPVMTEWAATARVCVPVIDGPGKPLRFRAWTPVARMVDGPFGAKVPEAGDWITPEALIVPLVAYDGGLNRLGYGGGYYDRTLALLRGAGRVVAVGFAYSAQHAQDLPGEPTDARVDAVVTEAGITGKVPRPPKRAPAT